MNLMCPARLILLPPGSRDDLAGERVAEVYASPAAEDAAAQLADHLGVLLTVVPDLRAPVRVDEVLREIADQHRGEAVVVVAPGIELPAGRVVVEHTGDGWSVVPSDNAMTLATYEQAAERFRDSIPREPSGVLLELFDLIDAHLSSGGSVLELGSGTGRDAIELEQRGHRVRRTDATGAFVEMIRADGYQADQLNAVTDEFGGPYDLVFADAVFLHFGRDQLATVLRKAAAAANLLAFTTREGDGSEWSTRHLDLPRHFTMWQEQPLRDLLTDTGWTILAFQRGQTRVGGWFYILARAT